LHRAGWGEAGTTGPGVAVSRSADRESAHRHPRTGRAAHRRAFAQRGRHVSAGLGVRGPHPAELKIQRFSSNRRQAGPEHEDQDRAQQRRQVPDVPRLADDAGHDREHPQQEPGTDTGLGEQDGSTRRSTREHRRKDPQDRAKASDPAAQPPRLPRCPPHHTLRTRRAQVDEPEIGDPDLPLASEDEVDHELVGGHPLLGVEREEEDTPVRGAGDLLHRALGIRERAREVRLFAEVVPHLEVAVPLDVVVTDPPFDEVAIALDAGLLEIGEFDSAGTVGIDLHAPGVTDLDRLDAVRLLGHRRGVDELDRHAPFHLPRRGFHGWISAAKRSGKQRERCDQEQRL
jgi:hypothetical protein